LCVLSFSKQAAGLLCLNLFSIDGIRHSHTARWSAMDYIMDH